MVSSVSGSTALTVSCWIQNLSSISTNLGGWQETKSRWKDWAYRFQDHTSDVPWSKVAFFWGWSSHLLIGNPYNGYINPYYWVDDHPLRWNRWKVIFTVPKKEPLKNPEKNLSPLLTPHSLSSHFFTLNKAIKPRVKRWEAKMRDYKVTLLQIDSGLASWQFPSSPGYD